MHSKNSGAFVGKDDARVSIVKSNNRISHESLSPIFKPSAGPGCAEGSPERRPLSGAVRRPAAAEGAVEARIACLSRLRRTAAAALLALVACLALPQAASATAPTVSSAEVTAAKPKELVVTFSEALATGSVPAAAAFAVKVGGSAGPAVSSVAIDGGDATKLKLGLAVALDAGQTSVTVDYTKPGSNPLKDGANNEVATFTNQSVTNNAPACPSGQPSNAFWTACVTVGQDSGGNFFGFGGSAGSLSSATFTRNATSYTIDSVATIPPDRGSGEIPLELSFAADPGSASESWTFQVGSRSYRLAESDGSFDSSTFSYEWTYPGFAWAAADVGDKVSVSLRPAPAKVGLTFSPSSVTVDEGSTAEYTVQLDAQPSADVTVTIATRNMFAATAAPATLTFTRSTWNRPQRVTVTGVQDGDPGDERVMLDHIGVDVTDESIAVTVNDDDAGAVPSASANVLVSNLHESRHQGTPLLRAGDYVAQAFTTGPNLAGYALESADVVFEDAPKSSGNVTVSIREDSSGRPGSAIMATLASPSNLTFDGTRRFGAPAGTVLAADTTYWLHVRRNSSSFKTTATRSTNERGADGWSIADRRILSGSARQTPMRMAINGRALTPRMLGGRVVRAGLPFLYVLQNGTFGDPAGAGLTYSAAQLDGSPLPDWLTFDPRRRTLRGTPTNADATGPDERIFVAFTATDGNGGKQLAALRIGVVPDEDPPVLRSVTKGARTLALAYSEPLDEDSTPGVGAFTVTHGNTLTDIPVSGVDVTGRNVVLTLATAISGVASVGYTVPTGANAMPIRDVAGTDAAAFDRTVEDFTVSVRALQPRVSEGAESAGFEISLDPVPTDPNVAFFVHWETVPGTAVPHWKSQTGADYTGTGGGIALGNGGGSKPTYRVWVPIADDGLDEPDETFGLRIALGFGPDETDIVSPAGAPQYVKDLVVRIVTAEAEVTVEDNDSGPSVTLRAPGGRLGDDIREGDEEAAFGVWLLPGTGSVSYPVTVNYAVRALTAAEAAEADGRTRATAGTDFTAATGMVTFNTGETYKTVPVDVPRTPELEGDEYFAVELSGPSGNLDIEESLGLYLIYDNPGPYKSRMGVGSGAPPESEGGGCGVNLSVEFRDGNGDRTDVSSLAASDFAVENGRIGTPVADADGLRWTVPAWATAGFTGLMRVRLVAKAPDPEGRVTGWEAAEQVLRVVGDNDCTAVARNTLAALALEGLDLDPSFDAATTAYTAAAPADTDMVTVTASAVYGTSDVAIAPADADEETDGHQVALAQGGTGIAVTVTPADGSAAKTWTVAVTGASDPGVLTGFVLVDASNDADLGAVERGGTVSVSADGSYGVRAEVEANAEVGSVVLTLAGPGETDTHTRTENIAPWSLYGDAPGGANGRAEHGRALPAGTYTLTATAYAERSGAGDVLGTLTVPFTVEVEATPPPAGVLTGFMLVDAATDADLGAVTDSGTVTASTDGRYGIRAETQANADVGSVVLTLAGPGAEDTHTQTENIAPYSLYGDAQGAEHGRALPAGSYTLSATAYAERGASGTVLGTLSVSFEVLAPALLSVADARAEEGTDATLDFAVTLNREAANTVTVDYATADGTATAGSDYTATSGTLTFAAGETEKTVSVPVLEDDHDEGSETLTLRLSNAQGAQIADGEATGTIANSDAIPEAWLARFGRTVTGQVLDAVEARLAASRRAGADVSLAGQALPSWRADGSAATGDDAAAEREEEEARAALASMTAWLAQMDAGDAVPEPESRALTGRDFITGTSFALTGGSSERGGFAGLWGRGSIAGFDGREGDLTVDGEVTTGLIGTDWATGRWTAGMALGHSTGTGIWRGANGSGGIDAVLTGLYPYAGMDLTERLTLWTAAGWGSGEVTVTPDGESGMTADLTMSMGAAGLRGAVLRPNDGDGLSLDLKGDARFTRTSSDAVRSEDGNLAAADAEVWLLRTGLEGSRRFALPGSGSGTGGESGATLTPSFEIGLRLDGGDAETGMGADLGGGLAFADPANGLSLDLRGRALMAHEASGLREWGTSATLGWDPRSRAGRGPSASLRQSWGASPAGGMDALLSRETLAGLAANDGDGGRFEASNRLEGELGYGLPAFGGGFIGTPNVEFGMSDDGTRDWRLGWRLRSALKGDPGFEISLDATRRKPANDDEPEHGAMLRGTVGW